LTPARISGRSAASALFAAEEPSEKVESEEAKDESEDAEEKAEAEKEADEKEEEEEEEEVESEEDAALRELKEKIAKMEATLNEKKSTLQYTSDKADEFSQAGYARKVAEMENMRRIRRNLQTSNKSTSKTNILKEFLPVYDRLDELNAEHGESEFGSKYGGLSLKNVFTSIGVTEYSVEAGSEVNYKVKVASSQVSADVAKDCVIEQVATGLELDGNLLKEAECIVSLGAEEEPKEDDEGKSDDAADETEESESEGDAK